MSPTIRYFWNLKKYGNIFSIVAYEKQGTTNYIDFILKCHFHSKNSDKDIFWSINSTLYEAGSQYNTLFKKNRM